MPEEHAGAVTQEDTALEPQAGTTTEPQEGDESERTLTLAEAKKLRSEASNLRKRLKAFEEKEQKEQEASMTEQQKKEKQYAESQAAYTSQIEKLQARVVRNEVEKTAAKLGMINPELAHRLIDWAELEFDEDGSPTNAKSILEKIIKDNQYLVQQQQAQKSNAIQKPTLPAMNPGRSSISTPASPARTTPPKLTDVWRR